jgi:hypothetical protein
VVASVFFDDNDKVQYWTKFKRFGENGSVYTKKVYNVKMLANGENHFCKTCGKPFADGDVVTLAPEGVDRRHRWKYFHERCYEENLKKANHHV